MDNPSKESCLDCMLFSDIFFLYSLSLPGLFKTNQQTNKDKTMRAQELVQGKNSKWKKNFQAG